MAATSATAAPSRDTRWRGLALAVAVAAGLILVRAWLAVSLPLTDTTEARYGEMARMMVATGDWLVPQHALGVPYLAKPPLAMWLSAAGIAVLGPGQLGPRILIFAVALAFVWLTFAFARAELGVRAAVAAAVILMSSLLFFVAMAATMTDMVFSACVGAALLGFWKRWHGAGPRVEVGMYVALALGLMTKGPLAAVLFGMPLVAWAGAGGTGQLRELWRRFAWCKGAVLTSMLVLPWYAAAEWRNPGFLEYFVVGEHLQRFLTRSWSGDLYGYAHAAPLGTIWLFFLLGTLPWSALCVPAFVADRGAVRRRFAEHRELVTFALTAAATPLVLFTFAANIIFPYALPAIAPAVLAAVALLGDRDAWGREFALVALGAALLVATSIIAIREDSNLVDRHTQLPVIAAIHALGAGDEPIYYWKERFFSADYYSRGRTEELSDPATLEDALRRREAFHLVIAAQDRATLPDDVVAQLALEARVYDREVYMPGYAAGGADPTGHAQR